MHFNIQILPFWHLMSLGRYTNWVFVKELFLQLYNNSFFYILVAAGYI